MFHREGIEKDLEISVRMLALQKRNTDSVNIEAKTPILSSHQKNVYHFLRGHSFMYAWFCPKIFNVYLLSISWGLLVQRWSHWGTAHCNHSKTQDIVDSAYP